jgi:hypothetical protein
MNNNRKLSFFSPTFRWTGQKMASRWRVETVNCLEILWEFFGCHILLFYQLWISNIFFRIFVFEKRPKITSFELIDFGAIQNVKDTNHSSFVRRGCHILLFYQLRIVWKFFGNSLVAIFYCFISYEFRIFFSEFLFLKKGQKLPLLSS